MKYFIGPKGAGKTLNAMSREILPALAKGQKVITNINGVADRVDNICDYLAWYNAKHGKSLISQNLKTIANLKKEKTTLRETEQSVIEDIDFEIDMLEKQIEFIKKGSYKEKDILKKLIILKNENEDYSNKVDKIFNGEVFNIFRDHKDEEGNSKFFNSVIVIDEAKKFFSKENVKKITEEEKYNYAEFFGESRHFGYQLVFIDQEFWTSIDPLIRQRVDVVYALQDSALIGVKNGYFATVFTLTDPTGTTFKSAYSQTSVVRGRYDKKVFKCYRSTRKGAVRKKTTDKFSVKHNLPLLIFMVIALISLIVFGAMYVTNKVLNPESYDDVTRSTARNNTPVVDSNTVVENENNQNATRLNNVIDNSIMRLSVDNNVACNSSFNLIKENNFETSLNKDGTVERVNNNIFLNKNNYHLQKNKYYDEFVIYDDTSNVLFSSDIHTLIYKYNLEYQYISDCHFKLKYENTTIQVMPSPFFSRPEQERD